MRTRAQILPDRIPPNVARDILERIRTAEGMVVVAHFPEPLTMDFLEFKGRAQFENTNKFQQIRSRFSPLSKHVDVIGHKAVRMEPERTAGGALSQDSEDALRGVSLAEVSLAAIAANSHEMNMLAAIAFRRETGTLAIDRHTAR